MLFITCNINFDIFKLYALKKNYKIKINYIIYPISLVTEYKMQFNRN